MGTEKNDASVAPIPAPPVTPAVPGPPMPAGAGVVFTPVSAQGKKRMKLIGILVGVLVVLVIAGVVAIKVVNSSRTPEAEVRKYLDLLAAGKASAATAMVDPGVPNNQRTFLTDDAMASATSLLVVEDVVADKNDDSDTRTVTATLSVDGQHFTRTFTVVADDPAMGVFNTWTIKESLATAVSVSGVKSINSLSAASAHRLRARAPPWIKIPMSSTRGSTRSPPSRPTSTSMRIPSPFTSERAFARRQSTRGLLFLASTPTS